MTPTLGSTNATPNKSQSTPSGSPVDTSSQDNKSPNAKLLPENQKKKISTALENIESDIESMVWFISLMLT